MATQADVRAIALSLPDTREVDGRFAFAVQNKGKWKEFVWIWMERVEPDKPRVPCPRVVAVRVSSQDEKHELIQSDPDAFFTEPHYANFPAVLVRLAAVRKKELTELVTDAWRCQAPRALVKEFDASG